MFEYETLKLAWWLLISALFTIFILTDGFDLGMAIGLPWVAKTPNQRRVLINTVGSSWEGNQTWLIIAGAACFAAWPTLFGVAFSGLYLPLILTLFALILRPPAFDYRGKSNDPVWQARWDWVLFASGLIPTLVLGVGLGNLFIGLPFELNSQMQSFYRGSFWELFTPFPLVCGLASVAAITMHGSAFLATKIEKDEMHQRAARLAKCAALLFIVLFALGGFLLASHVVGFSITQIGDVDTVLNPLAKEVSSGTGFWLNNFTSHPRLYLLPGLSLLGVLGVVAFSGRFDKLGFVSSGLALLGALGSCMAALFPFVVPSSFQPNASMTLWDSSSSALTLKIMLIVTIIFLPIIVLYVGWAYRVMRGRVSVKEIEANPSHFY